eukprot:5359403-Pyramimonas_sp.AAC.1
MKELHAVVVPLPQPTQQIPALSGGDLLEGKMQEWMLSCGEDLFDLADFADVAGSDRAEAKKREEQLKEQFQSLAQTMYSDVKQKAE